MKKRFISLLLAGLMILAILPMLVGAEGESDKTFTLSLSTDATVNKAAGSEVYVDVLISNVPDEGIVSVTIPVMWNKTELILIEVMDTNSYFDIEESWCGADIPEGGNKSGKYYLAWNNDTMHDGNYGPAGYSDDGKLCTLKFKLINEMTAGERLDVELVQQNVTDNLFTIMSWYMNDYMSKEETKPDFGNGMITVVDRLPGDLDENGEVNENDAIYLLKHSIFQYIDPTMYPIDSSINVDYDSNHEVNENDAIYLLKHSIFQYIDPGMYPIS